MVLALGPPPTDRWNSSVTHSSAGSRLMTRIAEFTEKSIAAGRVYADEDRVSSIVLEPATGLLSGKVLGTQDYRATAKLVREHDGVIACRVGICNCPVRQNCKHVVALIAAAEQDPSFTDFFVPEEAPREPTFLETLLAKAKDSKAAPAPAPDAPAMDSWEAALSALLPPAATGPSPDTPALGLQFELHVPPPRFSYRGRGSTAGAQRPSRGHGNAWQMGQVRRQLGHLGLPFLWWGPRSHPAGMAHRILVIAQPTPVQSRHRRGMAVTERLCRPEPVAAPRHSAQERRCPDPVGLPGPHSCQQPGSHSPARCHAG